jgi:aminopeptidase YwaD
MIIEGTPTPTIQALNTTRTLIDRLGGRLAGTESCRAAGRMLKEKLQTVCGNARLEPFETHPDAFMGFYRINVSIYLVCILLLNLGLPLLAGLGLVLVVIGGYSEFGYYKEFFDWIFPKKTCENVCAYLEPQEKPTRQIIISGHHDSALELNLLKRAQKLYALKIIVPDIVVFTALLFTWLWVFSLLVVGRPPSFTSYGIWFLTITVILVFTKFFTASRRVSPGAGDNLIASAILIELAKLFACSDETGKSGLQHTRLIFASFDAEESGLRGSKAFVGQHLAELRSLPTSMLNIDSIYNVNEIQFLISDLNGTVSLSRSLASECMAMAAKAGYRAKLTRMLFGGGGTDAAMLAKAGVEATTLLAMPTSLIRDGLVYHTMQDTIEAIEPGAVEACIQIAASLVENIDQRAG